MLCEACEQLISTLIQLVQDRGIFGLHGAEVSKLVSIPQATRLKDERIRDCYLCRRLECASEEMKVVLSKDFRRTTNGLTFGFQLIHHDSEPLEEIPLFWVQAAREGALKAYETARKAKKFCHTGTVAAHTLAKHWLEDCLLNHAKCKGRPETQWYPTRLLEVSGQKFRLITTDIDTPDGSPYITLSHCWGKEKFLVLTAENKSQFEAGLSVEELPANFKDAIEATRRLGFRYIWIDSYCIIQDSVFGDHIEDKMLEISRMREVYANSILNIGASHATNPQVGFFAPNLEEEEPIAPPIAFTYNRPGKQDSQTFYIYVDQEARNDVAILTTCPIFSRAWILQERLLCPRMLHFGPRGLYWECQELLPASEAFPCGQDAATDESLFSINTDESRESALVMWCRAVTEYSRMNLSYPTVDKFNAIGGIAQQVAEAANDTYVAGFLRGNLMWQLCWYCRQIGRKAEEWRAPSWSWASTDGEVVFRDELMGEQESIPMATIEDVKVELLDSQNPYGALTSASLHLKCRLPPITISSAEPGEDEGTADNPPILVCLPSSSNSIPVLVDDITDLILTTQKAGAELYILPLFLSFFWSENIMMIEEAAEDPQAFTDCGTFHALLVQKLDSGEFVRVGCVEPYITERADGYGEVLRAWNEVSERGITLI